MLDLALHPHPCEFRLVRSFDRGWGEAAFEYRWDSTSGVKSEQSNPDLAHCRIYELIRYVGPYVHEPWFNAPDPPFAGWQFRNPTDGRTAPVGLECFSAAQGWAWDRHKLLGRLVVPDEPAVYTVRGIQEFRFTCDLCGAGGRVPGSESGPHEILRTMAPTGDDIWRYTLLKHGIEAWMDLGTNGYLGDSARIGFGPW